jgi:histidinol-phosphatase (PHP family)
MYLSGKQGSFCTAVLKTLSGNVLIHVVRGWRSGVGTKGKAGKTMLVDYHTHPLGHRGGCYTEESLEPYLAAAQEQQIEEIGLSDHDEYCQGIDFELVAALAGRFPSLKVKNGMEFDFMPGRERKIFSISRRLPFDYLIGSVHEIGDWMFDHPDYQAFYSQWDINELYRTYFSLIEELARSGLFDIVGHFDLIKVFGYRPAGPVLPLAGPALQAIKEGGLTVEVNTRGCYKPCAEIYPAAELLQKCYELDIPVTLGSDAHEVEETGRDLHAARQLLYRIGYRRLSTFSRRQRIMQPL